jgi:MFS family permease
VHACVLLLPPLFVDVRRAFGVGLLAVGAVANGMYLAFGVAALPGGWLADRLGSRRMLAVSAGGCGAACAAAALAPGFGIFAAALIALGAFAGLHHPSGLSLVSRRVPAPQRGRALGIHGLGGALGEALAPAAAVAAARAFGWRYGFGLAALLALGSAALAVSLPRASSPLSPATEAVPAAPRRRPGDLARVLAGFWRVPALRWLLLAGVAAGFVYRGVLTFLPLHFTDAAGAPLAGASLITLVLLAGTAAQLWGGALSDRLPRERLFLVEVMLAAPVLLLLGLGSPGSGAVVLVLCFGFLWSLAQPLAAALAAAHAAAADLGLLYGVQLTLSFGVGSFAASFGAALAARGGTRLAFLGFGAFALLELAAAIGLVRATRASAAGARLGGGVGAGAVRG